MADAVPIFDDAIEAAYLPSPGVEIALDEYLREERETALIAGAHGRLPSFHVYLE